MRPSPNIVTGAIVVPPPARCIDDFREKGECFSQPPNLSTGENEDMDGLGED